MAHDATPYFHEIIAAHVAIQDWFTGNDTADLDALLSRFSAQFSMVSAGGAVLDKATLRAMFEPAGGRRPGLEIVIVEMTVIAVTPPYAMLGYRERQTDSAGHHNERLATVVFEADGQGRLQWRHLQETYCVA